MPEYPIKSMADLNNEPPVNWMIKNWIPWRELCCFWGDPGAFKSFIGQGLSLQLATQNRIKVVYVAAEGASGLSARVHAWNALNMGDPYREDPNWYYMPANVNYESRDNRRDFVNSIYQTLDGPEPDLIVLDTLARNFFGDENSAKEMGQFIEGVEETRRDCGCAVWIIHHANVSQENRRERGSAALRAAMFAMFHISDPRPTKNGMSVNFECDRMKDGEIPDAMRVDLHKVDLESDQEGDVFRRSLALPHFPTRAASAEEEVEEPKPRHRLRQKRGAA